MPKSSRKYSLEALRNHTRDIRLTSAEIVRQHGTSFDSAIRSFEEYFKTLEDDSSIQCNVQKLLATKFFNHWYATLLLCEAGLMADALVCERSALETMAYHWLVRLNPAEAETYEKSSVPKPVEVRKRLETLGADISHLRFAYSFNSGLAHVGRDSEPFHLHWQSVGKGQLLLGGRFSKKVADHWFVYLPVLLRLFEKPLMTAAEAANSQSM